MPDIHPEHRSARKSMWGMMSRALVPVLLLIGAGTAYSSNHTPARAEPPAAPVASVERIAPNDNRRSAGTLQDGVLTLRLDARNGSWYPEGPDGPAYPVAAFAEEGGPLQNPGPLIRVPVGTEVRVTVRNSLAAPLAMFGLAEARGVLADSFPIAPGETREMRFTASVPGTYYYAGKLSTTTFRVFGRRDADSQLNGVIVVDPAGTRPRSDERIFAISWWISDATVAPTPGAPGTTLVINGLSWPHTERLDVAQGDSLYWRWVSFTAAPHPMHLHGFYFRVDAKGTGARDTIYAPDQQRLAVTEVLRPGETMALVWSPERPGNWVFHCHLATHITPRAAVDEVASGKVASDAHTGPNAHTHAMSRLVLGIHVQPRGQLATSRRDARSMRLLIRSRPNAFGDQPAYAYVLGGSPQEADPSALPIPGPTLVLEKDQQVAITLVNRTHELAAVHWHGIELESFPDGVPGWSGSPKQLLQPIPVGDSLTVRFTPPRAGTFMYHSHFNEQQQISSGLFGPIVVLEPGRRYQPDTDQLLIFSDGEGKGSLDAATRTLPAPFLNGRAQPEPMSLRAGVAHRLRVVNVRANLTVAVELRDGDRVAEWRHVAKDGAELPPAQAIVRPAFLILGPGEIHDVELTPRAPGELQLRFGFPQSLRPPEVPPPVTFPPPATVTVHAR